LAAATLPSLSKRMALLSSIPRIPAGANRYSTRSRR
jgi:hypothetical protein